MHDAWQEQFPFWSRRTIQATFRCLERLGVVESTQAHNRSRWDKTKWYSIDYKKLAEQVPAAAAEGPADERAADAVIDGEASSSSWKTMGSSMGSTKKRAPKRGCAREPSGGARTHPLEDAEPEVTRCHLGEKPVNELDAAYEAIPETERGAWYERAD